MKVWENDFFVSKEAMEEIDKHWNNKIKTISNSCPECSVTLEHSEGCLLCRACGWTSC